MKNGYEENKICRIFEDNVKKYFLNFLIFNFIFSLKRWFFGIILFIISVIVLAPISLHLYGDVILTKMFFQTWCKSNQNFIKF
jgi:hypothetical protein